MPIFWWGLLLIMFAAVNLGIAPVSGRIDPIRYYFEPVTGFMTIDALLSDQPGAFLDALHHLVLPTIVLGTESLGLSGSAELRSSVRPPMIPTTARTMLTYMHQRQST